MATPSAFHGKIQLCGQISSIYAKKCIRTIGCFQNKNATPNHGFINYRGITNNSGDAVKWKSAKNSHFDVLGVVKSGLQENHHFVWPCSIFNHFHLDFRTLSIQLTSLGILISSLWKKAHAPDKGYEPNVL